MNSFWPIGNKSHFLNNCKKYLLEKPMKKSQVKVFCFSIKFSEKIVHIMFVKIFPVQLLKHTLLVI